jgi:hypothetical protein
MICILCSKEPKVCRCNFKKPIKAKRGFSHEIYTTIPRTYSEMMQTITDSFKFSIGRDAPQKCIFKITVHAVET